MRFLRNFEENEDLYSSLYLIIFAAPLTKYKVINEPTFFFLHHNLDPINIKSRDLILVKSMII